MSFICCEILKMEMNFHYHQHCKLPDYNDDDDDDNVRMFRSKYLLENFNYLNNDNNGLLMREKMKFLPVFYLNLILITFFTEKFLLFQKKIR